MNLNIIKPMVFLKFFFEVAAGTDCSKSQGVYPVAPINSDTPEMVMLCHVNVKVLNDLLN